MGRHPRCARGLLLAVLLATPVAGCAGDAGTEAAPDFETGIVLRNAAGDETREFRGGEPITLVVTIRNRADAARVLTLPSSQTHDCVVFAKQREEAWRWSRGRMFTQVVTDLAFAPGETRTFTVTWNQTGMHGRPVPPGAYRAVGLVPIPIPGGRSDSVTFAILPREGTGGAAREAAPPTDPGRAALLDTLRRIQNTCFGLYPADLLRKMTGKDAPVPESARNDPRLQMKYLRTEGVVMKGLFYPSLLEEILPAFEATLRPGMKFLDLGSGDGRVVFMAALFGTDATGIEYDREIYGIAVDARRALKDVLDTERATLKRGDFFKIDFSVYDVLFYFGSGSYREKRLFAKIRQEMRPGAVFLLAHGQPESLPDMTLVAEHGEVSVYRSER